MPKKPWTEWKTRALEAESWQVADKLPGKLSTSAGSLSKKKKLVQDVHLASDFQAKSGQVLVQQYVLVTFMLRICTNTYNAAWVAAQKGKDVADYAYQNWKSRYGTLCLIVSLALRLRSQLNCPEFTVSLSLLAYQSNIPRRFWDVLSHLRILMSYRWTEEFCIMCLQHEVPLPFVRSKYVAVCCYDNCDYYIRHSYNTIATKSEYFHAVNWYSRHVPLAWEPDPMPANAFVTPRKVIGLNMSPDYLEHTELLDFCANLIGSLHSDEINNYPPDPNQGEPTPHQVGTPLVNIATSSYQDNCVVMWYIHYIISLVLPALTFMFIVGDEQTFDRMIKLKTARPNVYDWLIPIPGEFHFVGHVNQAILRLWWGMLLQPCSIVLQREDINRDAGMKKFNQHDEFLFMCITAIHMWFEHVFGHDCLCNEPYLRDVCKDNATSTLLLDFMYCDGMPYAALRRLLRKSPDPGRRGVLNLFYAYYCMRLRATNKYLYSMLCVHYLWTVENLHPSLYSIWAMVYTASVLGHPGRCTPMDGFMEKINMFAKRLLGNCITAVRVQALVPLLNVLMRVWARFIQAWGRPGRRWLYMGAPTFEEDFQEIFEHICEHHASDWQEATQFSDQNNFLQQQHDPQRSPNTKVLDFSHMDWQRYITGKCDPLMRWI